MQRQLHSGSQTHAVLPLPSARAPPGSAGRKRAVTCRAVVAEPKSTATSQAGPVILDGQVLHSIAPERLALVSTLGSFVTDEVSPCRPPRPRHAAIRAGAALQRATARASRFSPHCAASRALRAAFGTPPQLRGRRRTPVLAWSACGPQVQPLLKPVDKCWQPADFLPASEDPYFMDAVRSARSKQQRYACCGRCPALGGAGCLRDGAVEGRLALRPPGTCRKCSRCGLTMRHAPAHANAALP